MGCHSDKVLFSPLLRQALCCYDNKGYRGRFLSPSSDTSESFQVTCVKVYHAA